MKSVRHHLREGLKRYLSNPQLERLALAKVGIAGAGGLGSNIAMLLARSGVENLVLADYDRVETSNLNRQHFWPRHLNVLKVEALAESLRELNPDIALCLFPERLDEDNLPSILGKAPIWAEAMDEAQAKASFVEKALLAGCQVVAASGICGIGGSPFQIRKIGKLVMVGDFMTGVDCAPPMAPRVTQAAAMIADIILGWILTDQPE